MAWAAGFFDGEGSITFDQRTPPKSFRVRITNTEPVLLERFVAAVGVGSVRGLKSYSALSKKPQFIVDYGSQQNIEIVLGVLMKYMGPRKKARAEELLAHYPTQEEKRRRVSEAATKRWATRRANQVA